MKDELAKFNQVILKFDEYILEKASKKQLQDLDSRMVQDYLLKSEISAISQSLKAQSEKQDSKLELLEEIIKKQTE